MVLWIKARKNGRVTGQLQPHHRICPGPSDNRKPSGFLAYQGPICLEWPSPEPYPISARKTPPGLKTQFNHFWEAFADSLSQDNTSLLPWVLTKHKTFLPYFHPPQRHLFQPLKLRCSHLSPICRAETGSHSFCPQCLAWWGSHCASVPGREAVLLESRHMEWPSSKPRQMSNLHNTVYTGSGNARGKRQAVTGLHLL